MAVMVMTMMIIIIIITATNVNKMYDVFGFGAFSHLRYTATVVGNKKKTKVSG